MESKIVTWFYWIVIELDELVVSGIDQSYNEVYACYYQQYSRHLLPLQSPLLQDALSHESDSHCQGISSYGRELFRVATQEVPVEHWADIVEGKE